jgi:hypothetical protein
MPESQGKWIAKTIGVVILAAAATAVLTLALQRLIWHQSSSGVAGGAAAGVAVAVAMSRRHRTRSDVPGAA